MPAVCDLFPHSVPHAAEMKGDYAAALDYANRAVRLFGGWKNTDGRQQQVNMRHYIDHLLQRQTAESALSTD